MSWKHTTSNENGLFSGESADDEPCAFSFEAVE